MGLRLKFNLVILVVFLLGLGVTGYISYDLLHKNARDEVVRNAGVMMEAALSMRGYTVAQVRPLLPYDPDTFHPQSVPAYAATAIMDQLRKKYADYTYKEAALNPTNPRNRAVEWETDIVNSFRNNTELKEVSGTRETPTGPSLYLARPFRSRTRPVSLATRLPTWRRPPWLRFTGPTTGSAGSTWRSSARRLCRCRWRCRSRMRTARSSPSWRR